METALQFDDVLVEQIPNKSIKENLTHPKSPLAIHDDLEDDEDDEGWSDDDSTEDDDDFDFEFEDALDFEETDFKKLGKDSDDDDFDDDDFGDFDSDEGEDDYENEADDSLFEDLF